MAGADRIRLTEQIAVMDLMALGRFVLQREDDLNLAALLRSPLCGIGEEEIVRALPCAQRHGLAGIDAAGRMRRSKQAHIFLSDMLERADYAPPFEFYTHALTALGKRRDLLARLGPESADAIEEFLSLALAYERDHTPSLEGFLDWMARGNTEIKRDMERGRDEVRVMTVHGAKGLEADIVILPDTTTLPEPPCAQGPSALWGRRRAVPVSGGSRSRPSGEGRQGAGRSTRRCGEHRRLLYVALTRARDRLYICGFENKRGVRRRLLVCAGATRRHETLGVQIARGMAKWRRLSAMSRMNSGPAATSPAAATKQPCPHG